MLCHSPNRTLYGLKWNSLKRDKLSVADCFPLSAYFSLFFFPPLLPSNDDPFPLLASLSNIRRQIIAAINPRLIEPNAGCRCLLLAKSISHYKSIGPFLSTRTHLPIKLRHSLSPSAEMMPANWITSPRNFALQPFFSFPPSFSSHARSNLSIYVSFAFPF